MSKKLNTKDLVAKIEKVTKERITQQPVVSLDQFRNVKSKLHPKTILLIEDDVTMQAAIQRIFQIDGYVLKIAADATELSKVLDGEPIDLILMDIGLPWVNGFELAQMMKEHPDLKSIPLIFVSGNVSDQDLKKAFEIGADDFIKKPFDVERLRKTVHAMLKIRAPIRPS